MEESSELPPVDVSILISDQKKDSCLTESFGVNVVLQSDRGCWQLSHWAIFMLTAFCCSWQTFSPAFLVPASSCTSVPWDAANISSTEDTENRTSAFFTPVTAHKVNSCFTRLKISSCSGKYYNITSTGDSVIVKCQAKNDDNSRIAFYGEKYVIAAAKSIYMLGSFVAVIFVHHIANKFGQRCVVFSGFLLFYSCAVAACFTNSVGIFIALRFFVSLGITSVYCITLKAMLVSVVSDHRQIYAVIGYLGWTIAYMLLPAIAWCTTDWFSFQASISIPLLLLAAPLCFFPESVDYLLRHGKVRLATEVLKSALRKNGRNMDDVSEFCHQSQRNLMNRSHDPEQTLYCKLREHLGYRNLIFYIFSFVMSVLYYLLVWEFYLLPEDPFIGFAWAAAMETLAIFLLIFFGYVVPQRWLLFLLAMGTAVLPLISGLHMSKGEMLLPVYSYMAGKFFSAGTVVLVVIRGFEESCLLVTSAAMFLGAAMAPLLDEMIIGIHAPTVMTVVCVACVIFGILTTLFPLCPSKCSLQNPLRSNSGT